MIVSALIFAMMTALIAVGFGLHMIVAPIKSDTLPLYTLAVAFICAMMQIRFLYSLGDSTVQELLRFALSILSTWFVVFGCMLPVTAAWKWIWFLIFAFG
jgi:hypothetical protein